MIRICFCTTTQRVLHQPNSLSTYILEDPTLDIVTTLQKNLRFHCHNAITLDTVTQRRHEIVLTWHYLPFSPINIKLRGSILCLKTKFNALCSIKDWFNEHSVTEFHVCPTMPIYRNLKVDLARCRINARNWRRRLILLAWIIIDFEDVKENWQSTCLCFTFVFGCWLALSTNCWAGHSYTPHLFLRQYEFDNLNTLVIDELRETFRNSSSIFKSRNFDKTLCFDVPPSCRLS